MEQYATKFSMDPDKVFMEKRFCDVIVWIQKWAQDDFYFERYQEMSKIVNK